MSNHSHLHEVKQPGGQMVSVDAFGTREECDLCRERAGLPSVAEEQERMASAKAGVSQLQGGQAPTAQLEADLAEAERTIDELREQIKAGNPELARERDIAKAENGTLQRALHAAGLRAAQVPELEQRLTEQGKKVVELTTQLTEERAKSAALEQQLATKGGKKP